MKRWEMLSIIADYIYEYNVNSEDCLKEANRILSAMEYNGMLPPYRKKSEEEKELIDAINQYEYCHRWDDEV